MYLSPMFCIVMDLATSYYLNTCKIPQEFLSLPPKLAYSTGAKALSALRHEKVFIPEFVDELPYNLHLNPVLKSQSYQVPAMNIVNST